MDMAMIFWDVLVNPNVAYLLLIIGLWALMASFAVPGTGVPEVSAAVCLVLALLGLARLPVNVAGMALILLAMALLLVDLKVQSHGALSVGGTLALAIGSLFLFRPVEGQAQLSIGVIAVTTLGTALFFGVALAAAVRAHKRPVVYNPQAVTGQVGQVRDPINPIGTVQLRSELWSAKSETPDETIESGVKVIVTELDGLTLKVKKA
jgi:membrane-bound serine protease (ClpP class)